MCPWLVEHDDMKSPSEAETAPSSAEAVEKIVAYLRAFIFFADRLARGTDSDLRHRTNLPSGRFALCSPPVRCAVQPAVLNQDGVRVPLSTVTVPKLLHFVAEIVIPLS